MYATKDKLLQSEQYIFNTPLLEWNAKTTSQLEDWINKYKPIISQSLRLAKKHTKQNTQDLRKFYFRTATLPVTAMPKLRKPRKPKQTRRNLIQRTLKNQAVREQMTQPRVYQPKPKKNPPSTNIIKNIITMKPINSFFPPKDTRTEHRKAKIRDRTFSDASNSGESNNIPE